MPAAAVGYSDYTVSPVPEVVREYIVELIGAMEDNDLPAMRRLYYGKWTELTKMFYNESEWPEVENVLHLVENSPRAHIFSLCYKELYFRHINVHGSPHLHHRLASWKNYCALFEAFLDEGVTGEMELPLEWVNDMLDEFLYQFQDFSQYRAKVHKRIQDDIQFLEANPEMWRVQTVLGYLNSFVAKSGVSDALRSLRLSSKMDDSGDVRLPALFSFGFSSLVGLCRIQCLLADYRLAVKSLAPVDIDDKRGIFTVVTACHITLFYYLGFSYMMMGRYADALNVFSAILISLRTSKGRTDSFADDSIMSKYGKICALAAISYSLTPGYRLDETVKLVLMDKYSEKINFMANGARGAFQELFGFSAPKFISPATPNYAAANATQRPAQLQQKWFLAEIDRLITIPAITSYIKMYKSISMAKLSKFCGVSEEELRGNLIATKNMTTQMVHPGDASEVLSAVPSSVSNVNFYIVDDMVHITETERRQKYAQYFLDSALKMNRMARDVSTFANRGGQRRYRHHHHNNNNNSSSGNRKQKDQKKY